MDLLKCSLKNKNGKGPGHGLGKQQNVKSSRRLRESSKCSVPVFCLSSRQKEYIHKKSYYSFVFKKVQGGGLEWKLKKVRNKQTIKTREILQKFKILGLVSYNPSYLQIYLLNSFYNPSRNTENGTIRKLEKGKSCLNFIWFKKYIR